MTKSSAPSAPREAPRVCPTCGTRVGAAATKCLVCGADLSAGSAGPRASRFPAVGRSISVPNLNLSPVLLIAIIAVLAVCGIGLVVVASGILPIPGLFSRGTATPTGTPTLPPTLTPTATATETPAPTPTPLPPVPYTVVGGDTCISIAVRFKVSVQSIIDLNKLTPNCILSVGAALQVPQPTVTPTPLPTATSIPGATATFHRETYTVHLNDTCGGIANHYHLSVNDIMKVNGITDCITLREGQVLVIPLELAITPGPTPTATTPPPYPAPNQLVPSDGQPFTTAETSVTLQWTSVGELRADEFYEVVAEDVTCNCARIYKEYTTETRSIIPAEYRPTEGTPHIFRWHVGTVRQKGTSATGEPLFDSAGRASAERVFSWFGPGPTPSS
jgi:LysM repeat protein